MNTKQIYEKIRDNENLDPVPADSELVRVIDYALNQNDHVVVSKCAKYMKGGEQTDQHQLVNTYHNIKKQIEVSVNKTKKRKLRKRFASVAALLCCVILSSQLVAYATGRNLFQFVFHTAQEKMSVAWDYLTEGEPETAAKIKGYTLTESIFKETDYGSLLIETYSKDKISIVFQKYSYHDTSWVTEIETDDTHTELTMNGQVYYCTTNGDYSQITWQNGLDIYILYGEVDPQILVQIISKGEFE